MWPCPCRVRNADGNRPNHTGGQSGSSRRPLERNPPPARRTPRKCDRGLRLRLLFGPTDSLSRGISRARVHADLSESYHAAVCGQEWAATQLPVHIREPQQITEMESGQHNCRAKESVGGLREEYTPRMRHCSCCERRLGHSILTCECGDDYCSRCVLCAENCDCTPDESATELEVKPHVRQRCPGTSSPAPSTPRLPPSKSTTPRR